MIQLLLAAAGRLLAAAAMAVATVFAAAAIPANAAKGEAAIHLRDLDHPYSCWLSSFTSGLSVHLSTKTGVNTVKTPSGNVKLICRFDIPEGAEPGRVLRNSGFRCGIYLPTGTAFTSNTRALSTPGGQAKLECEINPSALKP